jgi:peptide/nickel transport system substrate-binding protein
VKAESLARGFLRGDLSRRDFLRRARVQRRGARDDSRVRARGVLKSSDTGGATGTSGSAAAGSIKPGGTLQAALTGEPDTLDPATSTIYTGAQVYDNIFSKLIDIDTDGSFVGVLATDWNADDDTTWTFNLVDGVTFHNGETFTADDVKYTFERIPTPRRQAPAPLYDVEASRSRRRRTVFHLKTPFGQSCRTANNGGRGQKAVGAADPRATRRRGPFKFVEWVQGDASLES